LELALFNMSLSACDALSVNADNKWGCDGGEFADRTMERSDLLR
jgi:hypothetical protein